MDLSKEFMYTNILHFDDAKGSLHIESELVSWMLKLFNGSKHSCGSTTTGGTESILLAIYTYREFYRKHYGIYNPEIVAPSSIHVAFDKGCDYFGVRLKKVPINPETGLCSLS